MAAGRMDALKILERSPLDVCGEDSSMEIGPGREEWVGSRYNVLATAGDGRLLVWNTLTSSINAFPSEQQSRVRALLSRKGIEAVEEGLVGYLAQRGYLVKRDTDEFLRFRHRFGLRHYASDELELMLLASEDCNFRCEYCYETFPRGTMQPWVRDAIKKLVDARLEEGLRSLKLSWFGGEPLYGMEAIEDLGPFFHDAASKRGIRFSAGITTNGFLLTRDVAAKLLEWGTKNFQVTLDGPAQDHDRLRHTRTGEGSFDQVFRNILSIREFPHAFNFVVRINFDPQSHPRLDSFIDRLGDELGHDKRFRLLLRPVGHWGGSNDENVEVCGSEEQDEVIERLTLRAHEAGLGDFDDLRISGRFGALACYAARPNHLLIGADGKVMKCTVALDTMDENVVGRIAPEGTLDLDDDKLVLRTEPVFDSVSKCRKCVVLPTCQSLACPLARLEGAETSCPPVRASGKKRLMWTQRVVGEKAKDVVIRQRQEPADTVQA